MSEIRHRLVIAIGWTLFIPVWVVGILVITLLMPLTYVVTGDAWYLDDRWLPIVLGK